MTSKQYKAIHFLEEARNHFNKRRDYVINNLRVIDENGRIISNELPNAYGWDTINEIRKIVGMKPSKDPKADELRNKNLSQAKEDMADYDQQIDEEYAQEE